ncbi:MAG: PcfJ domain-containing protein, partial [Lachnospiraceae bacterium]|nr:PcfJ domain-containing protein [Lachnospiraceae bacterium]
RWSTYRPVYNGYNVKERHREVVIYPKNITKLLKGTALEYMPIRQMLSDHKGVETDFYIFTKLAQKKYLEQIWKAGLKRLTWNLLKNNGFHLINKTARNPCECLGITKTELRQAVRMDVTSTQLLAIKHAAAAGRSMTDDEVRFFGRYLSNNDKLPMIFELTTPHKLMRYCIENLGMELISDELNIYSRPAILGDYLDFLDDLEYLHMDLKDNMYPKNFQAMHQHIATERKNAEDREKQKRFKKLGKELRKKLPELKKIFRGETEDLMLIWPTCKEDFNAEGVMQHNCVGGSYFERMAMGSCVVVFCRRKSDPDKSYTTVEFDMNGKVRQHRAYANKNAPEDAKIFIDTISKNAQTLILERKYEEEKKRQEKITRERIKRMKVEMDAERILAMSADRADDEMIPMQEEECRLLAAAI